MSAGRPTARQEAVLRVIRDVIADTGDAPTVREIGQRVGLSSSGSVAYRISARRSPTWARVMSVDGPCRPGGQ